MRNEPTVLANPTTDAPAAELHAVYVQSDGWIVAWLEDFPGVLTQGATLAEAQANLRDALRLMLESYRDEARDQLAGQQVVHRETLTIR